LKLNINTSNQALFAIIESDGRRFVNLSEVIRLYADGTCTWIYLINGEKVLATKNLGYYEKILSLRENYTQNYFFRVHHSHLINLNHITKYNQREKNLKITSGDIIPIAQRRCKSFKNILTQLLLY